MSHAFWTKYRIGSPYFSLSAKKFMSTNHIFCLMALPAASARFPPPAQRSFKNARIVAAENLSCLGVGKAGGQQSRGVGRELSVAAEDGRVVAEVDMGDADHVGRAPDAIAARLAKIPPLGQTSITPPVPAMTPAR